LSSKISTFLLAELRKKAVCMPLSWNRLRVFFVFSAHPVPDDLPCDSFRDLEKLRKFNITIYSQLYLSTRVS
jgi:hypothetical protein